MKPLYVARRLRAAKSRQIEMLESRCLLSATVVSQIPSQEVLTATGPTTITLSTYLGDPQLTGGTVVEMQTPLGNIPLQLDDSQTPLTVANFVSYINNGQYTPTDIQRSVPGFVLQGGGTMPDGATNEPTGTVASEAGIPNTTGTIAMALEGAETSAESAASGSNQWFINLADNTELNTASGTAPQVQGPFTVFGNVIDSGMTVANAIAALPIVDDQGIGSGQNENWGSLPVTGGGFTNGQTVTSVPAADIVSDTIVQIPAGQAVTYSATSSNPSIITASVANGVLTLAAAPGVTTGVVNVTTTATDLSGNTVSESFAASVNGFFQPITVGANGSKSITYKDADGTTGIFTLNGPGSAVVNFMSNTSISNSARKGATTVTSSSGLSVPSIALTGTTAASTFTINTRGGTGVIDVGSLSAGSMKSISARGVALTGDLTSGGSIGSLALASASGGTVAAMSGLGTLTAAGAFSDILQLGGTAVSLDKFTAGAITGGTWSVSGSVNSISAKSAANWAPDITGAVTNLTIAGNLTGTIQAASIKTLSVAGTLNATITAQSIATVTVKKNLSDSNFEIVGTGVDLGKLSIGGAITGSLINATGSIGPVTAASLNSSELYAGVVTLMAGQPLPNTGTDFASMQSITSVTLKTIPSANSFSNSDIAATSLGKLSLGSIMTNNSGTVNGVASEAIAAFAAKANGTRISEKNITISTDLSSILSELGDFTIKLF